MSKTKKPYQLFKNLNAKIASIPMVLTALFVFVGCTLWTVVYSFTKSRLLPKMEFVGFDQYERLWGTKRWLISVDNILVFGALFLVLSFVIGFLLAVMLDQKIRFENTIRWIILYPYALSFVITGLTWQWILNPDLGLQNVVRNLGWENFTFDPIYNADLVIYGLLISAIWQGSGLIMVLMLAGLRGIDENIWSASRIEGIPAWKTYLFIVIPMLKPVFMTSLVMISAGIIKFYDLVIAQTGGGPGLASEVPAIYVIYNMFRAQNLGQSFAASSMMLLGVIIILALFGLTKLKFKKYA